MEDVAFIALIGIVALYLGYLVNRWKIRDLEDRVRRLEDEDL